MTLLANAKGWYLAARTASNYDGLHIPFGDKMWKTLWEVRPDGECTALDVDAYGLTRSFPDAEQRIRLADDGLIIHARGACTLTLDCKRRFDESEHERHYTVALRGPHSAHAGTNTLARVTFADVTYACPAGTISFVIATTMRAERIDAWRNVRYPYDERRGTRSTPWVYDALRLTGEGRIALALDERQALGLLIARDRKASLRSPKDEAWHALDVLRTERGVIAGLPWFTQVWSRDELIAVGGLLARGMDDEVVRILDRWYSAVHDGVLPAIYPDEGLRSADAPGWLGRRTLDILARGVVTPTLARRWLPAAIALADGQDVRDGLVWTGPMETWMDTAPGGDGRAGARVEIQALFLALCDAIIGLARRARAPVPQHIVARHDMVRAGLARLIQDGRLIDGLHADGTPDMRIRPNIFLAWYANPRLFPDEEWRLHFGHALRALWLPWGGLASLDPKDPGFLPSDRGENNAAYHHGDSWYYVNNVAAIALAAVGGFEKQARALVEASLRDLRTQGYEGCASEISSAAHQEAMGCHAQAWSASTLVEAIERTFL